MRIRSALVASAVTAAAAGAVAPTAPASAGGQTTTTITIADSGDQLSLGQLARIVEKHLRVQIGAVDRAIVVGDLGGTPLPAAQLDVLFSGRDAGDVRLLATVDGPPAGTTVAELSKAGGRAAARINLRFPGRYVETTASCDPVGCSRLITVHELP